MPVKNVIKKSPNILSGSGTGSGKNVGSGTGSVLNQSGATNLLKRFFIITKPTCPSNTVPV
jgi:hypothetical protein